MHREYIDGGGTTLHECGEHLKSPKVWNVPPPKFHGNLGIWEEGDICIQQEKQFPRQTGTKVYELIKQKVVETFHTIKHFSAQAPNYPTPTMLYVCWEPQ